jgi:hypothetical protein
MIPASMILIFAISAFSIALRDKIAESVSAFLVACQRIARCTQNSIRNEMNKPAITIAAVVAS